MESIKKYDYDIDGMPLYIDNYVKDDKIYKYYSEIEISKYFLIANKKTADKLFYTTIKGKQKLRKDKLKIIYEI